MHSQNETQRNALAAQNLGNRYIVTETHSSRVCPFFQNAPMKWDTV